MLYVYTENLQEQKQLELEFAIKNNYYLVPSKQSYFLSEMLTAISHEFFQNKIPLLVQKIKDFITLSFSKTYTLASYRDLMRLIKKQQDNIQMYRQHLIDMNRAFAEDNLGLELDEEEDEAENNDQLFEQALNGQTHQPSNLDLLELPLASELHLKFQTSDAKTQKTMQSDLCWGKCPETEIERIIGFNSSSVDNVFSSSGEASFQNWKNEKVERTKAEGSSAMGEGISAMGEGSSVLGEKERSNSKEMSSFKRKGSTIYVANKNLKEIFVSEIQYDLNRQIKLGSAIFDSRPGSQSEKLNPQKKIRSALMNYKLKHRKK